MNSKPYIEKYTVIGWLIYRDGLRGDVFYNPIVPDAEGYGYIDVDEDNEMIGVIPALPGTLEVHGYWGDNRATTLGMESPTGYNPNWEIMLEELIEMEKKQ